MKKLIEVKKFDFIHSEHEVQIFRSDELPDKNLCTAVFAIVYKDGALLLVDLKESERKQRKLDIPGGHVEKGETLIEAVTREVLEETNIKIKNIEPFAHFKITSLGQQENDTYPYPESYMVFFSAEVENELPFNGNDEAYGRVWLSKEQFNTCEWCLENKILLNEFLNN